MHEDFFYHTAIELMFSLGGFVCMETKLLTMIGRTIDIQE